MATDPKYKLSQEQVAHFLEHGFVRVPECFSREKAAEWTADVWTRLGYSQTDKTTWKKEMTHMPEHKEESVKTFAPKAWSAICELLGGEDRIKPDSATWNDAFIVNLGTPETEGKPTQHRDLQKWHVDGDFFIHFLDSPEQALLVIPLFNDIQPNGGGTVVISDSIKRTALFLHDNPQGVIPYMIPRGWKGLKYRAQNLGHTKDAFYDDVMDKCEHFHEMTGDTGDVILLHPLMVHSRSVNSLRIPRIITNPPISLKEPFNFDRADPKQFSLVERKTLHDLARNRLGEWKLEGKRAAVVPERVAQQEKMKKKELKRMKS